jgi:hypothetical protein
MLQIQKNMIFEVLVLGESLTKQKDYPVQLLPVPMNTI